MLLAIVVLLILLDVMVVACLGTLLEIRRNTQDTMTEVRDLRLTARTRVRRAKMQNGATSDEQKLERLGRASVGRRVVVGGDPDSELHRVMMNPKKEVPENE